MRTVQKARTSWTGRSPSTRSSRAGTKLGDLVNLLALRMPPAVQPSLHSCVTRPGGRLQPEACAPSPWRRSRRPASAPRCTSCRPTSRSASPTSLRHAENASISVFLVPSACRAIHPQSSGIILHSTDQADAENQQRVPLQSGSSYQSAGGSRVFGTCVLDTRGGSCSPCPC